jgi:hypothetical protein
MLQILKHARVHPKTPNDPKTAPSQPVGRHRDGGRPSIGNEMLELSRKVRSNHLLRRQQRQKREKDDTRPREEAKRYSEEASAHRATFRDFGGFGKPTRVTPNPRPAVWHSAGFAEKSLLPLLF